MGNEPMDPLSSIDQTSSMDPVRIETQQSSPSLLVRMGCLGISTVAVLWLSMVACLFANAHPGFELVTHLSLYLLAICLVCVGLLLIRLLSRIHIAGGRRYRLVQILLLMVPTCYFAIKTRPWSFVLRDSIPVQFRSSESTVTVLSWNVWLENFLGEEIADVIRDADADIVVLIEVNHATAELLEPLRDSGIYSSVYWAPAWNSGGMVVFSKLPNTQIEKYILPVTGTHGAEVSVAADERHPEFRLLAVHTRSPTSFQRSLQRDRQFQALAEWSKSQTSAAAVIGDLNVTPWSPAYGDLLLNGELTDSRSGFGYCASWPSFLGRFGIPIDHLLTNACCKAVERCVLPTAPGSDHRPIMATLYLSRWQDEGGAIFGSAYSPEDKSVDRADETAGQSSIPRNPFAILDDER